MAEAGEAGPGRRAARGVAVGAEGFGLEGPRGWAFRGVGFDAEAGSLVALAGPSGSGRTCLLLALTGRMKPSEGRATVGSLHLPKRMAAVRRVSALAHVPGVTDLDPALTVGEHLRERALMQRRFDGTLRGLLRSRADRDAELKDRIEAATTAAGLDREALPKGSRTAVRDLDRMEALRLSVALALVGRPRLLGVDDTDLKLSDAERTEMWALLTSLTDSGLTVVAVCSEAPKGAVVVSTTPGEPRSDESPGEERTDDEGSEDEQDERSGSRSGDHRNSGRETADDNTSDNTSDDEETADALAETGRA
ncbi:ATP-binding cassette domain-containing protein [Streptomyces sp. MNU76]|uniref:ATP-binding cassette domain-containing protein n=1 Tax=Streptomyces sp. MNU76 TaxID=2560026 RepID=UPI001E416E13|nr:ATP-binding cassette domain-containing protein [Streptomyces sp. MNU76]MCC9704791.1 ATP-binding cassette domain-containing protein [Streptomyces sp. MNU76]